MSQSNTNLLRSLALWSFGVFLILMLGANSVAAAGGPLTWLTLWQLPSAGGDLAGVGPVILLPVLSVVAWAFYLWLMQPAERPTWSWGYRRITLPALALWLWALGRAAWQCFDGPCPRGTIVRLLILAAVFFWVYLLIANERPDLLWVIAPVIVLQSAVAVAQFVLQHDVGLQWLGELVLDPAVSGVSVVMNGSERWLRGYGLSTHPNSVARVLVLCLLMLPVVARGASGNWKIFAMVTFGFGLVGLATTLSRWGWACLILGLTINAIPYVVKVARTRSIGDGRALRRIILIGGGVALVLLLFLSLYGGAVYGRLFDLSNPLEAGSLLVRQRDMAASLQIWRGAFLTGVGPNNYESAAIAVLPPAALVPSVPIVPSVPLYIASELGLVGLLLWLWMGIWPIWRRYSFTAFAPYTALWLAVLALGLFGTSPYHTNDLRSALLVAIAAGLMAQSWSERQPADAGLSGRMNEASSGIGAS